MTLTRFTDRVVVFAQLMRLDSSLTAAAYTLVGAYLSVDVALMLTLPVLYWRT